MTATTHKFGIEIETTIPKTDTTAAGSYHHGTPIPWAPIGWNAQSDSSIHPDQADYKGIEIVSPILSGLDGLGQICEVMDSLKARRACPNKSTGLHVHVDARRLSALDIHKLQSLFVKMEKFFLALNGEDTANRIGNIYCRSVQGVNPADWLNSRYFSLNVANWSQYTVKKTVEFRLFSSTHNIDRVLAIVSLCVGMVEAAVDGIEGEGVELLETILTNYPIAPGVPVHDLIDMIRQWIAEGNEVLSHA